MIRSSFWTFLVLTALFVPLTLSHQSLNLKAMNLSIDPIEIDSGLEIASVSLQNKSLTYVVCDQYSSTEHLDYDWEQPTSTVRNCKLITETYNSNNTSRIEKTCNFKITADETNGFTMDPTATARIAQFEKSKIIVLSAVYRRQHTTVVLKSFIFDLPSCEQVTNSYSLDNKYSTDTRHVLEQLIIVPYSDQYDVIYDNSDICKRACSLSFDYEGSRLYGSLELNISESRRKSKNLVLPARFSSDFFVPGSCVLLSSDEKLDSSMIINERIFDSIGFQMEKTSRPKISTARGTLTVCERVVGSSRILNCSRDEFKTWFNLSHELEFQDVVIHNLANGGMMTLTSSILGKKNFDLILTVFDANGGRSGNNTVFNSKCSDTKIFYVNVGFYENEFGRECVSIFERYDFAEIVPSDTDRNFELYKKKPELITSCFR